MAPSSIVTHAGTIGDVFAHRFTLKIAGGRTILADLGPEGMALFPLEAGLAVEATGSMKPSELKVASISIVGGRSIAIAHKTKAAADLALLRTSVDRAGFSIIGAPRTKPKHVEYLASKDGVFCELHVAFDGHIRKYVTIVASDGKWAALLDRAS